MRTGLPVRTSSASPSGVPQVNEMPPLRHVIIGTGLAGLRAAEAIRAAGDAGSIIMVGAEHEPPYSRPPSPMSSIQFGRKLQVLGLIQGDEEILLRGRVEERTFTAFFLRGGKLTAAFALQRPRDILALRPIITQGLTLQRELLEDPSVDLQQLIQQSVKANGL